MVGGGGRNCCMNDIIIDSILSSCRSSLSLLCSSLSLIRSYLSFSSAAICLCCSRNNWIVFTFRLASRVGRSEPSSVSLLNSYRYNHVIICAKNIETTSS